MYIYNNKLSYELMLLYITRAWYIHIYTMNIKMFIIVGIVVSMMVVSCISLNKYLLGNGVYYNNGYGVGVYATMPLHQPIPVPEIKNKVYVITSPNSPYDYDKVYSSHSYSNF